MRTGMDISIENRQMYYMIYPLKPGDRHGSCLLGVFCEISLSWRLTKFFAKAWHAFALLEYHHYIGNPRIVNPSVVMFKILPAIFELLELKIRKRKYNDYITLKYLIGCLRIDFLKTILLITYN